MKELIDFIWYLPLWKLAALVAGIVIGLAAGTVLVTWLTHRSAARAVRGRLW